MRRALIVGVIAGLLSCGAAWAQITVSAPAANATWLKGTSHAVQWTIQNYSPPSVSIRLVNPADTLTALVIAENAPNTGSFQWNPIPASVPPGQYKVKVVVLNQWSGLSGQFTIAEAPVAQVKVTSPNGGESWQAGTSKQITWTPGGATGNVRIELYRNGTAPANKVGVIAPSVAAAAGTSAWTVGAYQGGTAPSGSGYRVMVIAATPPLQDASDNAFTIAEAPLAPIKVISPNGGESWQAGASRSITWTPGGATGNVRIELYRNGTAPANKVGVIAPSVAAAAGTSAWTVGAYQGGTAPSGSGYRVMVIATTPPLQDASDGVFTIAPKALAQGLRAQTTLAAVPQPGEYVFPADYNNWMNCIPVSPYAQPPQSACNNYAPVAPGTDTSHHALVGYNYHSFVWPDTGQTGWLTTCYRSRVYFLIDQYKSKASKLVWAKMHIKQDTVQRLNDNHASCATGYFILTALWTNWYNPPITAPTPTSGLLFGSTDYTVDVTSTVRKWFEGSPINYGFLLVSQEIDFGQQPKICGSAFDVSLTLKFDEN